MARLHPGNETVKVEVVSCQQGVDVGRRGLVLGRLEKRSDLGIAPGIIRAIGERKEQLLQAFMEDGVEGRQPA